jgi:hypothetical protein
VVEEVVVEVVVEEVVAQPSEQVVVEVVVEVAGLPELVGVGISWGTSIHLVLHMLRVHICQATNTLHAARKGRQVHQE